MSLHFDTSVATERERGLEVAQSARRRGDLVVLPTDTVYGLGCDAFSPPGVAKLLAAKGRGRDMPVPVLVGSPDTIEGLAYGLSKSARDLVEAFWPGALTVVVRHQPSLAWDLGDANGTVALRMPLHPVAIELLRLVGPMAVSSANRSGSAPATTYAEAEAQLGDSVADLPRRRAVRRGRPEHDRRRQRPRPAPAPPRRHRPRHPPHRRPRPHRDLTPSR